MGSTSLKGKEIEYEKEVYYFLFNYDKNVLTKL